MVDTKKPHNRKRTTDLYCFLPSGNQAEFPKLDSELIRRGIKAYYRTGELGSRLYRVTAADAVKLPHDSKGPYLGNDESGHSMYELADPDEYSRAVYLDLQWKAPK